MGPGPGVREDVHNGDSLLVVVHVSVLNSYELTMGPGPRV